MKKHLTKLGFLFAVIATAVVTYFTPPASRVAFAVLFLGIAFILHMILGHGR